MHFLVVFLVYLYLSFFVCDSDPQPTIWGSLSSFAYVDRMQKKCVAFPRWYPHRHACLSANNKERMIKNKWWRRTNESIERVDSFWLLIWLRSLTHSERILKPFFCLFLLAASSFNAFFPLPLIFGIYKMFSLFLTHTYWYNIFFIFLYSDAVFFPAQVFKIKRAVLF